MHISIIIVLKPKASTELRQSPACRDPKRETFRLPKYVGVSNRIRITVDLNILNQQNCGPQNFPKGFKMFKELPHPSPSCGFSDFGGIDKFYMVLLCVPLVR